jgi:hypothetical protein
MVAMQAGFRDKLKEQDTKMAAERLEFKTNLDRLTKDLTELRTGPPPDAWADAAAKKTATFPPAVALTAAASGSSSAAAAPFSSRASPAPRSRSTSAPTHSHFRHNANAHKILSLGFPREIPRQAHITDYKHMVATVPEGLLADTECQAGNAKAHSIVWQRKTFSSMGT